MASNLTSKTHCPKGMTWDTCPYNQRLGCDCGYHKGDNKCSSKEQSTNVPDVISSGTKTN